MLRNWKCPKCGKIVTKYETVCDECGGERGLWGWFFNLDNIFLWLTVMATAWIVAALVKALLLRA